MTCPRLVLVGMLFAALVGCGSDTEEQSDADTQTAASSQSQSPHGRTDAAKQKETPTSAARPRRLRPEQYRRMVTRICRATPLSDLPDIGAPEAASGSRVDKPPASREGAKHTGTARTSVDDVGGEFRVYVGALSRRIDLLQRQDRPVSMQAQIELLISAMGRLRGLILSEGMNADEKVGFNHQLDSAVSEVNHLTLAAKLHGCEAKLELPTQSE
jgi:hypothetical protein